jgi:hypothetical protein
MSSMSNDTTPGQNAAYTPMHADELHLVGEDAKRGRVLRCSMFWFIAAK